MSMTKSFVSGFRPLCVLLVLLSAVALPAQQKDEPFAYTVHTRTVGPITAKWEPVPFVTDYQPQKAAYSIANASGAPVECAVTLNSIDTIATLDAAGKQVDAVKTKVTVPAKGKIDGSYSFKLLPGTYNAHYPLHLYVDFAAEGRARQAHAVRVIETRKLATEPTKDGIPEVTVVKRGGVSLVDTKRAYKVAYNYINGERRELGAQWTGSIPDAHGNVTFSVEKRGQARRCFSLHPPYVPRAGELWIEYPVQLPQAEKVMLLYGTAMRTVYAPEPPSDGVTFRFWIDEKGKERRLLQEKHTTATVWEDSAADLTPWSGKQVTLVVEVHPGPKNNTTCDGCYLSGLYINSYNSAQASTVCPEKGKTYTIPLSADMDAVVEVGSKAILDSRITLRDKATNKQVAYDGLDVSLAGTPIESLFDAAGTSAKVDWNETDRTLTSTVTFLRDDKETTVKTSLRAAGEMLLINMPEGNPARLDGIAMKPADKSVKRVYFGHGFVVANPTDSFRVGPGGHGLSTSHVGFEYDGGMSVLMGLDTVPTQLSVDPKKNQTALVFSGVGTLALLPDAQSAFHAAVRYRGLCPWHSRPAGGVARKIGRLVFDVWGGNYSANTEEMKQAIAYGVTDSMFIKHVWQRWGYDVRLPNIWDENEEPNVLPSLGTLAELRTLAKTCRAAGIPFALHDNYIDYYPDADDFSYKYITFNEDNKPRKAWINHGAGVQSYQWRPDLFKPAMIRNLELGRKLLPEMDGYFVDVFTSTGIFDFFGQDGAFHPRTETQTCWKNAFETIGFHLKYTDEKGREQYGITISEAGSDFLIGSIDSADAQWMQLSPVGKAWAMQVPCEKWARTPWFTAVNHTNFSRHGAGYADRYVGIRSGAVHGVMSDDYISAEMLGGLDLMVVYGCVFPGSVRKHYLAQHVVRRLATKEIVDVAFDGGEIMRQTVRWSDGTRTCVNRSREDWKIQNGITLPHYGYCVFDRHGKILSGIVRNPDNAKEIVESSFNGNTFYLNGRGSKTQDIYDVTPSLDSYKVLDDGKFTVRIKWTAREPLPKDVSWFLHIFEPYRGYGHKAKGWFASGGTPSVPTSKWGGENGVVYTGDGIEMQVPKDLPDGSYHIMCGLFDKTRRYTLVGEDAKETRYSVASFRLRRENGKPRIEIEPIEMSDPPELFARLKANRTPISCNGVSTLGAVVVTRGETWSILPLPLMNRFDVTLDEAKIGRKITDVKLGTQDVSFKRDGDRITFAAEPKDALKYIVSFK